MNGEARILVKPVYLRTRTGPVPLECGIAKAKPKLTDWSRNVCTERKTQWRSSFSTPTNLRESSNVGRISSLRRKLQKRLVGRPNSNSAFHWRQADAGTPKTKPPPARPEGVLSCSFLALPALSDTALLRVSAQIGHAFLGRHLKHVVADDDVFPVRALGSLNMVERRQHKRNLKPFT